MRIDNELQQRIPPLRDSEYAELKHSIISEGCRDALIVWNDTLLDGHNRYKICTDESIPYETKNIDLPDREAAKDWIDHNQLGRRNLTPDQMSLLRGRIYNRTKKAHGGDRKSSAHFAHLKTANKLSEEFGVNQATIRRDAEVSEYLSKHPDEEKDVLSGKKTLKKIKKQRKQEKLAKDIKAHEKEYNTPGKKPICYQEGYARFLDRIKDKSADLLLTDPPYSTEITDLEGFTYDWLHKAIPKIKPSGRAYIFIGAYPDEIRAYLESLMEFDFIVDCPLVWTYRNTLGQTPNMKYNLNYQLCLHLYSKKSRPLDKSITNEMFSVQEINAPDGRQGNRFYKWQKPIKLTKQLIRHSTVKDDVIIDPFAGSGTFLLAGAEMGRETIGSEMSKDVIKIAEQRGVLLGRL